MTDYIRRRSFMRQAIALSALVLPGVMEASANVRTEAQDQLTKSIEKVLRTVDALKPGMTRADVLRNFRTEGGLSTRAWNHYVYQDCPFIKIDVTFDVPQSNESPDELPTDLIANISRPYLEFSILD
jgi:hypothetical protein